MRQIFFIASMFLALFCQAKQLQVCPSCLYKNLSSANDDVEDGDEILIKKGDYLEDNIAIIKSITITGQPGAHLIATTGQEILTIEARDVIITGLTFSGVTTNYLHENAAIRIKNTKGFRIENNIINNCFFAVYLEKGKNGTIRGNKIDGNASSDAESGNGIHAWHCDNVLIEKNNISQQRDGIYLEFVNNSIVNDNHSHHNTRYGLHYMFSNDDNYTNNIFEYNGVGVAVMFSRRIRMVGNNFAHNWGQASYGLLLKEIYDAEILNNQFSDNTIGIFVEGSNRINYLKNTFRRNGWAIKFSGGCESNKVTENDFLYNSIDLVVSSKLNDNYFDNNFWSEYAGYDLDKDGTGDIPHYPVKLYSYILNQSAESIVLMRSLFIDIINYAEKISPVFTPKDVMDSHPQMNSRL